MSIIPLDLEKSIASGEAVVVNTIDIDRRDELEGFHFMPSLSKGVAVTSSRKANVNFMDISWISSNTHSKLPQHLLCLDLIIRLLQHVMHVFGKMFLRNEERAAFAPPTQIDVLGRGSITWCTRKSAPAFILALFYRTRRRIR
jgi:hypothetical protein